MLTVVCWLWQGWRPVYTPEHVINLRNMLARHLRMPHRFVCVTDQPAIPGVECVPLWGCPIGLADMPSVPNCYRRLKLFADESFGPAVLSIDLDCVILNDITPLVERALPHDFMIMKGYANPYNGSLWFVRPGANSHVWTDLGPATIAAAREQRMADGRRFYGSDQSVMAYMLPDAPMWTQADGLYQNVRQRKLNVVDPRIVFFAGRRKPWDSDWSHEYQIHSRPMVGN